MEWNQPPPQATGAVKNAYVGRLRCARGDAEVGILSRRVLIASILALGLFVACLRFAVWSKSTLGTGDSGRQLGVLDGDECGRDDRRIGTTGLHALIGRFLGGQGLVAGGDWQGPDHRVQESPRHGQFYTQCPVDQRIIDFWPPAAKLALELCLVHRSGGSLPRQRSASWLLFLSSTP